MAKLILTFDWDGKTVHKKTVGFIGKDCINKTAFLEKALGIAEDRKFTSEYYEENKEVNKEKVRQ